MTKLTLAQESVIVDAALVAGRALELKQIAVAGRDDGDNLMAFKRRRRPGRGIPSGHRHRQGVGRLWHGNALALPGEAGAVAASSGRGSGPVAAGVFVR